MTADFTNVRASAVARLEAAHKCVPGLLVREAQPGATGRGVDDFSRYEFKHAGTAGLWDAFKLCFLGASFTRNFCDIQRTPEQWGATLRPSQRGGGALFGLENIVAGLLSDGTVEHMMPGRVRVRFRSKKGDTEFFRKIVSIISRHPAIEAIDANPRTGSVLIRHSIPADELKALAEKMRAMRGSAQASPNSGHQLVEMGLQALSLLQLTRGRALSSASEQLWQASQAARLQIKGAKPVLIALAALQVLRGRILSPASSLFMYSLMSRTFFDRTP